MIMYKITGKSHINSRVAVHTWGLIDVTALLELPLCDGVTLAEHGVDSGSSEFDKIVKLVRQDRYVPLSFAYLKAKYTKEVQETENTCPDESGDGVTIGHEEFNLYTNAVRLSTSCSMPLDMAFELTVATTSDIESVNLVPSGNQAIGVLQSPSKTRQ